MHGVKLFMSARKYLECMQTAVVLNHKQLGYLHDWHVSYSVTL